MDYYVCRALYNIYHKPPNKPQHTPRLWAAPVYGQKITQKITPTSAATPLYDKGKRHVQSIAGTFLYYSNIYPCTKSPLKEISTKQSYLTKGMLRKNKNYHGLPRYLPQRHPHIPHKQHDRQHRIRLRLPFPPQILQPRHSFVHLWK